MCWLRCNENENEYESFCADAVTPCEKFAAFLFLKCQFRSNCRAIEINDRRGIVQETANPSAELRLTRRRTKELSLDLS